MVDREPSFGLSRPRASGPHRAVRIEIPEDVSTLTLDAAALPGWGERGSPAARAYGDAWYDERRTAVLINPEHPDASGIAVSAPIEVPWDERLS